MAPVAGIAAIQSRIASIQSRSTFAPTRVNGPLSLEFGGPADPTIGFDPFGAVYQEAMSLAGIVDTAHDSAADVGHEHPAAGAASAAAPPVYGTGAVAAFTPEEFAGITNGPASDGMMAIRSATIDPMATARSTSVEPMTTTRPASLEPTTPLSGPVYTGNSRLTAATAPTWAPAVASVPGSSVGKIGGFGRMAVPEELHAYSNGRLGAEALVPIGQGGHRLTAPAAAAWRDVVAAAAADGIDLRVTDSYRSLDEQVDLAGRKGLYRDGGYAAVPGTSNHGWGLAVDADVRDPGTLAWMRHNAWRFGFVEAVPREPWHWEYRPEQA